MTTTTDLLLETRAQLVTHGWTRGTFHAGTGEVCLRGAYNLAAFGDAFGVHRHHSIYPREERERAVVLVSLALKERYPELTAAFAACWSHPNDKLFGSIEDALDVLDAAIAASKETDQ